MERSRGDLIHLTIRLYSSFNNKRNRLSRPCGREAQRRVETLSGAGETGNRDVMGVGKRRRYQVVGAAEWGNGAQGRYQEGRCNGVRAGTLSGVDLLLRSSHTPWA